MGRTEMSDFLDLGLEDKLIDSKTSDDYYTPPFIFEALGVEFDLDVSSPPDGVPWLPAKRYYTIIDDGLVSPWEGRVWMNPPYSDVTPWANKFRKHNNGIALVQISKARWFDEMWQWADALLVLPSNLKFISGQGKTAGIFMPAILCAMGEENVEILKASGLGVMR